MSKSPLKGVIAASITPVRPDYSIDVSRLSGHVQSMLEAGCSHVSCFGTTGEGAAFSAGQKSAALQALARAGADMGRHVPGVMSTALEESIAMLETAHRLGCRAALVLPPFYYGAEDEGILAFFDALIARTNATPIDLVLYNIPQMSGVRFSFALIEALLARHSDRIVGIKDSTGSLENGLELVRRFPQLAVMTGDDRVLPRLVEAGGAGMIGGIPNLCTPDLVALYTKPQGEEADKRVAAQARRITAIDSNGALVAIKAMLARVRGADYARVTPPLLPLSADKAKAVAEEFEATGFDFATLK